MLTFKEKLPVYQSCNQQVNLEEKCQSEYAERLHSTEVTTHYML